MNKRNKQILKEKHLNKKSATQFAKKVDCIKRYFKYSIFSYKKSFFVSLAIKAEVKNKQMSFSQSKYSFFLFA